MLRGETEGTGVYVLKKECVRDGEGSNLLNITRKK